MKVLHISYSDNYGGASIAAYRIHQSMLSEKIDSHLLVIDRKKNGYNIFQYKYFLNFFFKKFRPYVEQFFILLLNLNKDASLNILPSKLHSFINTHKFDVINLHWINNEMMSIKDIYKINGKVFWTLHDTWPFESVSHYPSITKNKFYKFFFQRKKKLIFKKKIKFISPSYWIRNIVKKKNKIKFIKVIRNPIDCKFWIPAKKNNSNKVKTILIGGVNILSDQRKGLNNLINILNETVIYKKKLNQFKLCIFGDTSSKKNNYKYEINFLGYKKEKELRNLYQSSDVLIVSSTQDNLPNVAIEAMACGLPVITTINSGLKEIIKHKVNGYVLNKFNSIEVFEALEWVFNEKLSKQKIHNYIKKNFSEKNISKQYLNYYLYD